MSYQSWVDEQENPQLFEGLGSSRPKPKQKSTRQAQLESIDALRERLGVDGLEKLHNDYQRKLSDE